jgi:2-polyprenyl-3-methyl-5-hydroxy-6-metoxy-1,4-benzoquinol methylase
VSITEATDAQLEAQVGAYAERLFETGLAALEALTISLGRELGLYDHLTPDHGVTATDLAQAAGIDARYAQEWLEQQAAAGLIDVTAPSPDAGERRFGLSIAAQECLLRPESLASVGPLFDLLPAVNRVHPANLVEAFRTGGGIAYADYALHDAQGDFNRPAYVNLLASDWLTQIPGLTARLQTSGARVAELGCGEGWAAISLATAFPELRVDGYDNDDASIAAARKHATEAGVGDRARFEVIDVTGDLPAEISVGAYDLVMALEMIHDLARPVEALTTMRLLGKPDAVHLVMDEKVAEIFEAPTENPIERLLYAASVLHCLPVGRADTPSVATGTVMRTATFQAYADRAGFTATHILGIEHDLFRFYHLVV